MEKYWDRTQWKQAMDMHGSEDEQEAYRQLARYLFPISMKLLTSRYFSSSFLNQNADLSLEKLAEEYVQRVLLKIFENYSNFKWQSEITTYAVRILQTEILQSLRRPAVQRELSTTFQDPDEIGPDTDPLAFLISRQSIPQSNFPEQQVQRAELLKHLRLALGQLSDLQYSALIMVAVKEIPPHQVAKELGLTMDALYKHISRARKSLRSYFESVGLPIFPDV